MKNNTITKDENLGHVVIVDKWLSFLPKESCLSWLAI